MERPNILLIMCDQLRADVLGCYGNEVIRTPNIDELAESGVRFDRAYSETPVCMPARYSLITGLHACQTGLLENTWQVPPIANPLPWMLSRAGYHTEAIGKMHFVPAREHYGFRRMQLSEEIPLYRQDDEYLMFLAQRGYGHILEPHGRRSAEYYKPQVSKLPKELHNTSWVADRTVEFIRENRNRRFFCFTSFIKPHPPWDPPVPFDRMYSPDAVPPPKRQDQERDSTDALIRHQKGFKGMTNPTDEQIQQMRAYYYGMVSHIDENIGKILKALEEASIREETVVILTADHGEMLGDHHAYGKRCYYEAAARIPLIISWPNHLPALSARDHLVSLCDLYPTFLSLTGQELPPNLGGASLLGILQEPGAPWRDWLVGEIGREYYMKFMLRWEDWKYIYHVNGGQEQLFNLKEDPWEFNSVAEACPEVCSKARRRLHEYYRRYGFEEALSGAALKALPYKDMPIPQVGHQPPRWVENLIDTD